MSLRFLDAGLETAYREECGSTPNGNLWLAQVVIGAGSLALLIGDAELRQSSLMMQSMMAVAAAYVTVLAACFGLRHLSDQDLAARISARLIGVMYVTVPAAIVVSDLRAAPDAERELAPPLLFGTITLPFVLFSIYVRHSSTPDAVRLGGELLLVAGSLLGPPLSSVEPPSETLIMVATTLLSELAGYSVELQRRLDFWRELEAARRLQKAEGLAEEMQREAARLRTDLTSVLSDEDGPRLSVEQLRTLVPPEERADGLKLEELFLEKRVGTGSFATVYRAGLRSGSPGGGVVVGRRVALKQPHSKCTERDLVRFVREMRTLRQLSHPHVVRFIGAVWEPSLLLVLEWMEGGSVHKMLDGSSPHGGPGHSQSSGPGHSPGAVGAVGAAAGEARAPLDTAAIALDVARGMAYLHGMEVAHRDLKAANVLLDGATPPRAKVADFGLSRTLYGGDHSQGPLLSRVGTPLWTAPEVVAGTIGLGGYTLACDVYSYAIFLLELEAFALVHERLAPSRRACDRMATGWRPPFTLLGEVKLLWLVVACWAQNPAARPSFERIVTLLVSGPSPSDLDFDGSDGSGGDATPTVAAAAAAAAAAGGGLWGSTGDLDDEYAQCPYLSHASGSQSHGLSSYDDGRPLSRSDDFDGTASAPQMQQMRALGLPRAAGSREELRQPPQLIVDQVGCVARVTRSLELLIGVSGRRHLLGRMLDELFADAAQTMLWRADGSRLRVTLTEVLLSTGGGSEGELPPVPPSTRNASFARRGPRKGSRKGVLHGGGGSREFFCCPGETVYTVHVDAASAPAAAAPALLMPADGPVTLPKVAAAPADGPIRTLTAPLALPKVNGALGGGPGAAPGAAAPGAAQGAPPQLLPAVPLPWLAPSIGWPRPWSAATEQPFPGHTTPFDGYPQPPSATTEGSTLESSLESSEPLSSCCSSPTLSAQPYADPAYTLSPHAPHAPRAPHAPHAPHAQVAAMHQHHQAAAAAAGAGGAPPPSTIVKLFAFLGRQMAEADLHDAMQRVLPLVQPGEPPVPKVLAHVAALRAAGEPMPPNLERVTSLLEEHWGASSSGMGLGGSPRSRATPTAGGTGGGSAQAEASMPEPGPGAVLHVELHHSPHGCGRQGRQCGGSSVPMLRPGVAAAAPGPAGAKPTGGAAGGDETTGLRRRQSTTP